MIHYFGPWSDPTAALDNYLKQKDDLHAGRTPRPDPATLNVKELANGFLKAKEDAVVAGELSQRTWLDYRSIMEMLIVGMGKDPNYQNQADAEANRFLENEGIAAISILSEEDTGTAG